MNGTNFRMPARRWATVATATALAAGPATLAGTGSAHASTDQGRASAVVLRTGLDVSLLNKTVNVPLKVALNEVQAPASAEKTALTAKLDGVNAGQPFSVLRADVATAKATVEDGKADIAIESDTPRGVGVFTYVEVNDVDEQYRSLVASGITSSSEPKDWPWGKREFVVRGDGRNLIDFMYVDDAVDAMLRVLHARLGERESPRSRPARRPDPTGAQ